MPESPLQEFFSDPHVNLSTDEPSREPFFAQTSRLFHEYSPLASTPDRSEGGSIS